MSTTTTSSSLGTALVTGASSGIGATYARKLAARGHAVLLVARNGQRLEALAAELRAAHGVKADVLVADLTAPADVDAVIRRLQSDTSIDLLLNNAGMATDGNLLDGEPAAIDAMVALNVVAVTRLAQAAAKVFAARGKGTLVNVASVLALAPERFNAVYAASKAFVLALTQGLDTELQPHGVRVQAVLPGATRTEIWSRSGKDVDSFPAEMVMEVDDMVDAALAGLDMGELVTIPPLQDGGDWDALNAARLALAPKLSLRDPAPRYGVARAAAVAA
ncbi:MAG: SDR family NAD(P)-dependent oxidoreductase [Pseudomonadota bacterium]